MKKLGFTLIEITLYVAISSFIISSLIVTGYTLYFYVSGAVIEAQQEKEGELLLSLVESAIHTNSTVQLATSTLWDISNGIIHTEPFLDSSFNKITISFGIGAKKFLLESYVPYAEW